MFASTGPAGQALSPPLLRRGGFRREGGAPLQVKRGRGSFRKKYSHPFREALPPLREDGISVIKVTGVRGGVRYYYDIIDILINALLYSKPLIQLAYKLI